MRLDGNIGIPEKAERRGRMMSFTEAILHYLITGVMITIGIKLSRGESKGLVIIVWPVVVMALLFSDIKYLIKNKRRHKNK